MRSANNNKQANNFPSSHIFIRCWNETTMNLSRGKIFLRHFHIFPSTKFPSFFFDDDAKRLNCKHCRLNKYIIWLELSSTKHR